MVMRDPAEIVKQSLSDKTDYYKCEWEQDDLEFTAFVTRSLLSHVYMLGCDFENAFKLAKQDKVFGWSCDNCQPLFVAFNLIAASKTVIA